jgi:hypothetical protein
MFNWGLPPVVAVAVSAVNLRNIRPGNALIANLDL